MPSRLQEITLSVLPERMRGAAERESRQWRLRCRCGFERSVWELGGVRFRGWGRPRRLAACPVCERTTWHRLCWREEPSALEPADVADLVVRPAHPRTRPPAVRRRPWLAVPSLAAVLAGVALIMLSASVVVEDVIHVHEGTDRPGRVVALDRTLGLERPLVEYAAVPGGPARRALGRPVVGGSYVVGQAVVVSVAGGDFLLDEMPERVTLPLLLLAGGGVALALGRRGRRAARSAPSA